MTTLVQVIYSIIIGAVQGISEWLPISSKTQVLVTATYLLNLTYSQAYTFGLFMEIGSSLAAIIYFRREIWALIQVLLGNRETLKKRLFVYVLTATICTGIIGAPLYIYADSLTAIPIWLPMMIIGLVLLGDAVFIRYSRKMHAQGGNVRKLENLSFKDYVLVGIAQGIAALPGVSRSGITTSTLLLMKVEADEAFRLSFIIGIFASLAAFALTVIATRANVTTAVAGVGITGILIAIATATVVSLFLIDFLLKIAKSSKIVYLTAALGLIALGSSLLYLALGVGATFG
jgi:undecaprenyl-diphosphatase